MDVVANKIYKKSVRNMRASSNISHSHKSDSLKKIKSHLLHRTVFNYQSIKFK